MSKMVEIGAHAGVVVRLGQFDSWTGEGAVTTDLVQCVSVSRVVTSVATLIQRLQTITLRKGTNSSWLLVSIVKFFIIIVIIIIIINTLPLIGHSISTVL